MSGLEKFFIQKFTCDGYYSVRSFGIMMLELSTGARRPYAKLTDEQVLQQVVKEQEIRVDKPNLNIHYANRW